MNKQKFLAYFKQKSQSKDETNGIQITNVLTSVTENVTSGGLGYAEEEMLKTYEHRKNVCNQFHNILRLFDVLPNFPLATSETMGDYYL